MFNFRLFSKSTIRITQTHWTLINFAMLWHLQDIIWTRTSSTLWFIVMDQLTRQLDLMISSCVPWKSRQWFNSSSRKTTRIRIRPHLHWTNGSQSLYTVKQLLSTSLCATKLQTFYFAFLNDQNLHHYILFDVI